LSFALGFTQNFIELAASYFRGCQFGFLAANPFCAVSYLMDIDKSSKRTNLGWKAARFI
jgi:hypothetical protein